MSIPIGVAVLFVKVTVCGAEVERIPILVGGKLRAIVEAVKPDGTVRRTLKSAGVSESVGWNGAAAGTRAKSDAVFIVGLFARFCRAVTEFVGAAIPVGVVSANRLPHAELSPATPPAESTRSS